MHQPGHQKAAPWDPEGSLRAFGLHHMTETRLKMSRVLQECTLDLRLWSCLEVFRVHKALHERLYVPRPSHQAEMMLMNQSLLQWIPYSPQMVAAVSQVVSPIQALALIRVHGQKSLKPRQFGLCLLPQAMHHLLACACLHVEELQWMYLTL